jgi:hypothetical protein
MAKNIKFSMKKCKNIEKKIKIEISKNDIEYLNFKNIIRIFWHTVFIINKLSDFVNLFRIFNIIKITPTYNYIEIGSNYSSKIPFISKIFQYLEIYSLNLQRKKNNNLKTQFYIKLNRYLNRTYNGYYRFIYSSKINNLKFFLLKNNFANQSTFLAFNLKEFNSKEIFELIKIIKNNSHIFSALIFENTLEKKEILNYITSSTNFKKSFIKFNLDRKNILLVNNKIHNLEYLVKKNMSFSLFENLFYFYLSKFVYYCSFIKKYFYFLKRYIKFF